MNTEWLKNWFIFQFAIFFFLPNSNLLISGLQRFVLFFFSSNKIDIQFIAFNDSYSNMVF